MQPSRSRLFVKGVGGGGGGRRGVRGGGGHRIPHREVPTMQTEENVGESEKIVRFTGGNSFLRNRRFERDWQSYWGKEKKRWGGGCWLFRRGFRIYF